MNPREPSSVFPQALTRLGRFQIVTSLGKGGMAQVYLARAVGTAGFERLVAVKLILGNLSEDPDYVAMFLDEARLAARLHHPNVVPIHDLGADDEGLYMVMDYIEGDNLASIEKTAVEQERALPLEVILRVVLDGLSGLDAAHKLRGPDDEPLNIVHRDVTPHNLLIGVDGSTRLADFGIARARHRLGLTSADLLRGKLAFIAPEQWEGVVDRRADIFSMGVTLWEAVTQRRCLPGRGTAYLVESPQSTPYRPMRDYVPSVPEALDTLCAAALAHHPQDRYPSAAAFAEGIEKAFRADIATPRQVGQLVSVVAAAKIRREREAVRESSESGNPETVTRTGRHARTETQGSLRAYTPPPSVRPNKPTTPLSGRPTTPLPTALPDPPPPPRVPVFDEMETDVHENLTMPVPSKPPVLPDLSSLEPPTALIPKSRRAPAAPRHSIRTMSETPQPVKREWGTPLTEDGISEAPPLPDEVLIKRESPRPDAYEDISSYEKPTEAISLVNPRPSAAPARAPAASEAPAARGPSLAPPTKPATPASAPVSELSFVEPRPAPSPAPAPLPAPAAPAASVAPAVSVTPPARGDIDAEIEARAAEATLPKLEPLPGGAPERPPSRSVERTAGPADARELQTRPTVQKEIDELAPWPEPAKMPKTFTAPPPPEEERGGGWMVVLVALGLLVALIVAVRYWE